MGSSAVRSSVRRTARRHPRLTTDLAQRLCTLGVRRLAERLYGAADVVPVRPPLPGSRAFRLLRCDGADQIAVAVGVGGWHGFERPLPDVFAFLARVTAASGIVIDVGANTGFYSLLAQAVSPASEVVAYEPYRPVNDILRQNLRLNRALDRIKVVDAALGNAVGASTLYVPDPSHGLIETSCSLDPDFRTEGEVTTTTIQTSTLDRETVAARQRVGLLKVDVEGTEHDVLAGAHRVLAEDRPIVVIEVLPRAALSALEAIKEEHGYVDIRLRPMSALVERPLEFDPDAWNHLWVPKERLSEAEVWLQSCGLAVTG